MSSERHLMTVPYNGHRDDETCPMCRERRITESPTTTPTNQDPESGERGGA